MSESETGAPPMETTKPEIPKAPEFTEREVTDEVALEQAARLKREHDERVAADSAEAVVRIREIEAEWNPKRNKNRTSGAKKY